VRRWQAFTGRKMTLLSDGRLFDVIAAELPPASENWNARSASKTNPCEVANWQSWKAPHEYVRVKTRADFSGLPT
jgi:hypothetical protein